MLFDINFYMEYLQWADNAVIKILQTLSDEEFMTDFGIGVGSIASKVGHLVGVYDFFIRALEDNPITYFPNFEELNRLEIISKWQISIGKLRRYAMENRNRLLEVPLAKGKYVNVELIFEVSIFHSFHHRGQVIMMFRMLGKSIDEIHPSEVNMDYFNYIFKDQKQLIFTKQITI